MVFFSPRASIFSALPFIENEKKKKVIFLFTWKDGNQGDAGLPLYLFFYYNSFCRYWHTGKVIKGNKKGNWGGMKRTLQLTVSRSFIQYRETVHCLNRSKSILHPPPRGKKKIRIRKFSSDSGPAAYIYVYCTKWDPFKW